MHTIATSLKLAVTAGVLATLAACVVPPQSQPASVASKNVEVAEAPAPSVGSVYSLSSSTPSTLLRNSPSFAVAPLEALAPEPFDALGGQRPRPALLAGESAREYQRGGASWYGPGFHGRRTANGERYDMNAMTAAHRTLPFGTWVRVHSLVNGREVDVRITDRGPFIHSRVIDLSRGAAMALGMLGLGFKEVVLSVPDTSPALVPAAAKVPSTLVKKSRAVRQSSPGQ